MSDYNNNYKISHTCKRCGYTRQIDAKFQKKFETRDAEKAGLCIDCRGLEHNRQRPTYVPNQVILELVEKLKSEDGNTNG